VLNFIALAGFGGHKLWLRESDHVAGLTQFMDFGRGFSEAHDANDSVHVFVVQFAHLQFGAISR
jgi:hypothetical protein